LLIAKKKGTIEEKILNVRQKLDKKRIDWRTGCDWITVDRAKLLENSMQQIYRVNLHKVFLRWDIIKGNKNTIYWRNVQ